MRLGNILFSHVAFCFITKLAIKKQGLVKQTLVTRLYLYLIVMDNITILLLKITTLCTVYLPKIKLEKEGSNAIQKTSDVISEPQGKSQLILTSMFYNTIVNLENTYENRWWLSTDFNLF